MVKVQEFKMGVKLRDRVTGLEGICTGRLEYMNGCVQFCIKPKVGKDGKVPNGDWIDSQQLEQIGSGISINPRVTGGYNSDEPAM